MKYFVSTVRVGLGGCHYLVFEYELVLLFCVNMGNIKPKEKLSTFQACTQHNPPGSGTCIETCVIWICLTAYLLLKHVRGSAFQPSTATAQSCILQAHSSMKTQGLCLFKVFSLSSRQTGHQCSNVSLR